MSKYVKESCPKCRSEGRDTTGDNLVRYEDGGARCFSCGYQERKGAELAPKSKLNISQVATYPVGSNPSRMIPDDITALYDIRVSVDVTTGKPDTVYYPYYNKEMYAAKCRKIADKKFFWVGSPEGLFGKQACTKPSPILIVTEGEEDTLAAKTILMDSKYGVPKDYHVVSVPNGAALDKIMTSEAAFFAGYKKIFVVFDNDEPGKKAAVEVADWLSTLTAVHVVTIPEEYGKDVSDLLTSGNGEAFRNACLKAPLYEPEGIVSGSDISLESLLEPLEEGYKIPFTGMQDKLHGLRKSEIVTICAGSGIGKSTMTRELAKSLIDQGCTVAVVALEDQMSVAAQALIALDMNIPLNKFRFSPPSYEETKPHYDRMVGNGKTFFFKHFGGLNSENLINKLYYYARSKRCDFIILDHLSMVISASNSNNERKDIDSLMTQLAKMVVETGVGLIQVVHLKRTGGEKSFAKGGEVELTDLRGSAALEQLSWAVVGMERDQQGDDSDFSRIRILKNRTFGFTGLCDTVKYDTKTGRMINVVLDPTPDEDSVHALLP